jgi:hypothetical protein
MDKAIYLAAIAAFVLAKILALLADIDAVTATELAAPDNPS